VGSYSNLIRNEDGMTKGSNIDHRQKCSGLSEGENVKSTMMSSIRGVTLVMAGTVTFGLAAQAQTFSVLHTFTGTDGANPQSGLILDSDGNLYGTTVGGGNLSCLPPSGCGVVFELDSKGKGIVLHRFAGNGDGTYPYSPLVRDAKGNLYGTTYGGGASNEGTVFRLDTRASNKETIVHSFAGADGAFPTAGLVLDSAGNLYGTTPMGGAEVWGVIFKLDSSGYQTVLHNFTGDEARNGLVPRAALARDQEGNLYGTTDLGGTYLYGVVFKLDSGGTETVLHRFNGADGGSPTANLIRDASGNLYGTTAGGGANNAGVVFKLDQSIVGNEEILHSFMGSPDGAKPSSGLIWDGLGNLYGTTTNGGLFGYGTVFNLDPSGKESILYSFTGGVDGAFPLGNLVRDKAGNLYGTTNQGGGTSNSGVVFKLSPR
jgi:uncharacterized repeat protein (TIGR03803 family)